MKSEKRNFLLKRLPILNFSKPQLIALCYDEIFEYKGIQANGEQYYERKNMKSGIIESMSQPEFVGKFGSSSKTLIKNRYISEINNIKWNIDKFSIFDLVIASVYGMERLEQDIPQEIKDVLLIEITDKPEFSDYMLADEFGNG